MSFYIQIGVTFPELNFSGVRGLLVDLFSATVVEVVVVRQYQLTCCPNYPSTAIRYAI